MGLLSDPSTKKQMSPLLIKFVHKQKFISILLFLAGITWLVALSYRQFNAGKKATLLFCVQMNNLQFSF